MVGKPFRKTPVFKARMTYLVLNPDWTVPPTILKEDILPRLVWDPQYLDEHDMVLRDRSGQSVAFDAAVLAQIDAGRFPYSVRQRPGPKNPLGRIKFMLPNDHAVYLHDTPSQNLFARADRSFSSGCIRVEHPLELAERLLQDMPGWNRATLDARIATGETQTVTLKTPLSVYIMYWTAEAGADGQAVFYNDLYERDAAVLAALKEPFRFAHKR
jgi:murein L,D-transpeptidase YcbB/YkuD